MAKRWGIKVAALSGLVALVALTAFPAVCWKEILIRYYEVVLRKEPNRCVHFLREPPSSAKRLAMRRFFSTPGGTKWLVRKYLNAVQSADSNFQRALEEVRTGKPEKWLLVWTTSGQYDRRMYTDISNWSFKSHGSGSPMGSKIFAGKKLESVLEDLQNVLCDRYPIPEDPQLTISIVKREDNDEEILGIQMGWPEGRVCLIERVDHQRPRHVGQSSPIQFEIEK